MILKLTKDGKATSYTVKRWNKMGASFSVTVQTPVGELPIKGAKYQAALQDGGKDLFAVADLTYQDFAFQGYVDDKDQAQVSVSDLVFSEATV